MCSADFGTTYFYYQPIYKSAMNEQPPITISPLNVCSLESAEDKINPEITHVIGTTENRDKIGSSSEEEHKGEKLQTISKKIEENHHSESICQATIKHTEKKVSVMECCSTAKPAKQHLDPINDSEPQNYLSLTNTLEKALHKISSTKKILNKTAGITQEKIIKKVDKNQEKTRITDHRREQLMQHLKKQLKEKPTIDKNSERIAKEMGHTPIVSRLQRLVEDKKKKLKENQEFKKKQQEEEEQLYIEQYNKHVKKPEALRSYEQYFNQMIKWKAKRQEQNKQKLELQKNKQLEEFTFQPTLNAMSKKLASSHHRLPIEQRYKAKKTGELNRSSQVITAQPHTQQ